MPEMVLAIGLLVAAFSLFLMTRQGSAAGLLDRVFGTRWLYAAALVRLMAGAVLIASAQTVAYPRAIALLGWLAVLGGLGLVAVPVQVLRRMAGRFAALPPWATRLWLGLALLFGLFLVYAALA